jgi:hypothetical protein
MYLRPDLGTLVFRFDQLEQLEAVLGVSLPRHNVTNSDPAPVLSDETLRYVDRVFAWDREATRPVPSDDRETK